MDEARRIIRYVLPGLVYIILLIASFFIVDPGKVGNIFTRDNISFGQTLGSLIVAGGLGYIFSILYFTAYWIWGKCRHGHLYDHLAIIRDLVDAGKLKIVKPSLDKDGGEQLYQVQDRKEAWYLLNVIWHSKTDNSEAITGLKDRLEPYYSNITNGLGTTIVATACSLTTFIYLAKVDGYFSYSCRVEWCVILYLFFGFSVWYNYYKTLCSYEKIVSTAFATDIFKRAKDNGPVKVVYDAR